MRNVALPVFVAWLTFAGSSLAQTAQGTYQGSYTGVVAGPPAPPGPKKVENIGQTGQFIFGVERITGLFFDTQTITYTDESTNKEYEHKFKATTTGLLGVDSGSPAQLPRFALDYVVARGFTVGGSFVLSTRTLSISDGGGQQPPTPHTANSDGHTLFFGGRVGYAYPFDSTFAIWPRAGLSYASSTSEVPGTTSEGSPTTYEYRVGFGNVNLEILGALSPIKHVVVLAGPYLDLGLGGNYSIFDTSGTEIDKRGANLMSFGLLVHAAGYY